MRALRSTLAGAALLLLAGAAAAYSGPAAPETSAKPISVQNTRPARADGDGAHDSGRQVAPDAHQEIPGQSAPAFVAAVALWLDGDEADGLGAMATLAQGGNPAARMLLALIDKTPELQGHWLSRLPRAERITLIRAPGGISGRSWMHAAAAQVPLAALWLSLWDVAAPMHLVLDFAAAGESRAARETAVALAARERRGFAEIADLPGFPRSLRFLVWREWDEADAEASAAERAALAPGDPQRAIDMATPEPDRTALARWLLSAAEAAPIGQFCRDRCAESADSCALAAWEALGSYRALLVQGSPSERLIPADRFDASRRGQTALLRRILLAVDSRGRRSQLAAARVSDSCFADLLETEAQAYAPRRD
jgi:hypothetical protein